MELRHLRYFVAVAEALSFTRAAERLYTSQPSLSEQIRNLEQEIGFTLLKRTRRKVELTEVGAVFLEEARLVLRQAEVAMERTRKVASQAKETLTIGFVPAAEVRVFPSALPALRSAFPKVDIVLRSLTSAEQEHALNRGEIDLAFMRGPIRASNLHSEVVLVEPIQVYLPVNHELAGLSYIPPHRLNRQRFVHIDREYGRSMHDVIGRYLSRNKVKPGEMYMSSNILMSINLVAGGLGYALLPVYAEAFLPKNVVTRPLVGNSPKVELLMVSPRDSGANSNVARSLMQLVRDMPSSIDRGG